MQISKILLPADETCIVNIYPDVPTLNLEKQTQMQYKTILSIVWVFYTIYLPSCLPFSSLVHRPFVYPYAVMLPYTGMDIRCTMNQPHRRENLNLGEPRTLQGTQILILHKLGQCEDTHIAEKILLYFALHRDISNNDIIKLFTRCNVVSINYCSATCVSLLTFCSQNAIWNQGQCD